MNRDSFILRYPCSLSAPADTPNMKESDVEVRPEDQTRINEFGRNNVRGVSRATRAARRAHALRSQARMHELREDIAGFQKARAVAVVWISLRSARRAHTRFARAQKLEELDDAMTEARAIAPRARGAQRALNPRTAPRAADDGRGRWREASSRRGGASRPPNASFPPPRMCRLITRDCVTRAVFHRRDRGVWHRVLRGATNEDASRARGGARKLQRLGARAGA